MQSESASLLSPVLAEHDCSYFRYFGGSLDLVAMEGWGKLVVISGSRRHVLIANHLYRVRCIREIEMSG